MKHFNFSEMIKVRRKKQILLGIIVSTEIAASSPRLR